ncbi:MFS transporter [Candidatus Spongiihabitans sp.]|uniref:MFS transporter n=1 Tax=Candidatus Spongiihabitans sp. TaxID=3101308 RepID=UPI003C6F121A
MTKISRKWFFCWFFIATFFQAGTYGLTFLLPILFSNIGGNEKDVGTVLLCTAIMTILTVLYSGHMTDRRGRIKTIAYSGIIIASSLYLFSILSSITLFAYLAGALLGIGWGLFYTLTPVVLTTMTDPEERVRYFTLLSVFIMAGFGLSPIIGKYLDQLGYGINAVFQLTAALCIFSTIIFYALSFATKESETENQGSSKQAKLTYASLRQLLKSKAIVPIVMVGLGASVFAGVTNFQTEYAIQKGQDYSIYFITYTITVIVCRVIFAEFIGGDKPYFVIFVLLAIMSISILVFIYLDNSQWLYIAGALLFGIGYGVSYPIVKAMAANEAREDIMPQTMQFFGISYFLGVFGFPLIAGILISEFSMLHLMILITVLSLLECVLAFCRFQRIL